MRKSKVYPLFHSRLDNNYILKCGKQVGEKTFVFVSNPTALFYVVKFDFEPKSIDLDVVLRDEKWNGLGVRFRRYYYTEVPQKYQEDFKEILRHLEGENLWLVQRMQVVVDEEEKEE